MKTIMSMKKGVFATNKDMKLHANAEPWDSGGCQR